jgi:hypothetical protein
MKNLELRDRVAKMTLQLEATASAESDLFELRSEGRKSRHFMKKALQLVG